MEVRDKLNTTEGYQEIIDLDLKFIKEGFDKINQLLTDEQNSIKRYPKPNLEIIKSTKETILGYQYDLLLGLYSSGKSIDTVKEQYYQTLSNMYESWCQSNGYVQMVWMLSIGIMLDIEQAEFDKLKTMIEKDGIKDYLIDFLISSRDNSWPVHATLKFSSPYKAITEIVDLASTDKQKSLARLQQYLKKEWYKGHSDAGWYNAHKSKWNIHTGYWSFESGALVKILGLDDSILKDQQYYPYDMVHWKD